MTIVMQACIKDASINDMTEELRCVACNAALAIAERYAGRMIVGTIATAFGLVKTRSVPATIAVGAIGTIVGHLLDEWRLKTGRIVCGQCGHIHQPA